MAEFTGAKDPVGYASTEQECLERQLQLSTVQKVDGRKELAAMGVCKCAGGGEEIVRKTPESS